MALNKDDAAFEAAANAALNEDDASSKVFGDPISTPSLKAIPPIFKSVVSIA